MNDRTPREHVLKCWPPFFQDVVEGRKRFEVRKNDRAFQTGDHLILHEFLPDENFGRGRHTGRKHDAIVTYVLGGGMFGVEPGYCVLGLDDWYVDG